MTNGRDDIPQHVRKAVVEALRAEAAKQMPLPDNMEFGETFERRLREARRVSDRAVYEFPSHIREWFDGLSRDDIGKLNKVIGLSEKTITWIDDKNERELKSLDGAVEFITSSRTAAKVMMWVCGTAVTFVTAAFALAKSGVDLFWAFRGGK